MTLTELKRHVDECGHKVKWNDVGLRGWDFQGSTGTCSNCGKLLSLLPDEDSPIAAFDGAISQQLDWKECLSLTG